MSNHQAYLPYMTNSLAIRQEIQRFESVHPSIYAIYDLIELVPDPMLAQQIREHVVCIEDSFVNSQEWTLSRTVPDIRLGIVGSLSSGKSALVHRYLTGSYMQSIFQEESPEGGRFKKEIVVDGQSYLLLIRDEGGPPELQFTSWVDAVIFVFSLENETSFNAIYNYYAKMAQYRNIQEIPLILVGTQDAINESNPRVIDDSRARKLANDLKRCAYYETCATYGLNVERVFQDACQKICQGRVGGSRPTTPNHFVPRPYPGYVPSPTNGYVPQGVNVIPGPPHSPGSNSYHQAHSPAHVVPHQNSFISKEPRHSQSATSVIINPVAVEDFRSRIQGVATERIQGVLGNRSEGGGGVQGVIHAITARSELLSQEKPERPERSERSTMNSSGSGSGSEGNSKFLIPNSGENKENRGELPTPSSTPTSVRKNRRRSNLFTPSGKVKTEEKRSAGSGEVGSGRSIPIRQGYLYKKSSKSFSKEWKKKYVTLCEDGRITYHPTLHDYMENIHGKEIPLQYVTVKVPGQAPRGSCVRTVPTMGNGVSNGHVTNGVSNGEKVTLTGYEVLREASGGEEATGDGKHSGDTPNVKKRHRRMKSTGVKGGHGGGDDEETYELQIVSLDNKQWHFEAGSAEDRDEWVQAIEQQILNSLQGNESSKSKGTAGLVDQASITRLKSDIRGNSRCVDCDSPNPDWASLNLGVLVCIECSGIHRNLGSHISRVRSLDLDEWPPGHIAVMTSLGNYIANSVWEARTPPGHRKPGPDSSREDKERYIQAKYDRKEWIAPLPSPHSPAQALVDAICRCDMAEVSLALSHCKQEDVNSSVSPRDARTPLHLAAALGNLPIAQLLIWANSNVSATDHEGRTCVSHARSSGAMDVVALFIAAGCPDVSGSGVGGGGTLPRRRGSGSVHGRSKEIASSVL